MMMRAEVQAVADAPRVCGAVLCAVQGMRKGVEESAAFILFLSSGVLQRPVRARIRVVKGIRRLTADALAACFHHRSSAS